MVAYLLLIGFIKSYVDPNIYIKVMNNELIIIMLHVDDLFITSMERRIEERKKMLAVEFEMKDL